MRILYLDCFSGISGDMTLAALVDAGADRNYVEQELKRNIQVEAYTLEWNRTEKCGISALKLNVIQDQLHPPKHHRHYTEIVDMIKNADFNERVAGLSLAIFGKIGAAEAKIHNIPMEKVHFHEVGAIDSIVDIIGIALAIDYLQIDHICSSPVPLGSGFVRCDHGIYPVPAPATLEMMKGLPIAPSAHLMELSTPTGAGIISGIVDEFSAHLPAMTVTSVGYGAGTRDIPNQPNVLRAIIGHTEHYINKWNDHHHEDVHHDHEHDHDHHHHSQEQGHNHDQHHQQEHHHPHEKIQHQYHDHDHDHGHDHLKEHHSGLKN